MFTINENRLHDYIKEDLPYFDLTTMLQDANDKTGTLEIFTRQPLIVSCITEACKIAEILGVRVVDCIPERQKAQKGAVLLRLQGSYVKLHQAWRSCQNLLEYACAIATYTHDFTQSIQSINPSCQLLATRKSFPFAKEFCIKSVLNGGGMIHRLNLSETILFFANHRVIYATNEEFLKALSQIQKKVPEKKIVVEAKSFEDAKMLLDANVAVIQTDKLSLTDLEKTVAFKQSASVQTKIVAAGGIDKDNCKDYVKTGIDAIVTSSVYGAKISDLGAKIAISG
jgi:molybdenum transport protein